MVRLTVKERILLHLLDFAKYAESLDVPPEITQAGLARAARIDVAHLAQYVRPLVRDGLVHERLAHIRGSPRRRRAYDLTTAGRMQAVRLREAVRSELVQVRDASGTREATVAQALQAAGSGASLVEIVNMAMESGAVDVATFAGRGTPGADLVFVERLADAPRLARFVGRRSELERLTGKANGTRVFVIRGVAGIGKSSLAAKACELLRGTRSLFWHRVRPWDSRQSILASLAEFLAATGRPGLRSVLSRGDSTHVDAILRQDLPGVQAFLVFDDAHEATPEVLALFGFLKDVVADAADIQMLVLTRRKLPFYDRRHVVLGGLVGEMDLEGLAAEDIAAFVAGEGTAPALVDLGRRLGGHPLSLELLRSATPTAPEGAMRDVRRFIEEEIYRELSDHERAVMKTACLYRIPVPREVLLSTPSASHDVLLSLLNRALLRRVGDDSYEAHDTIRDFFARILTPAEREGLGAVAAEQLRHLAVRTKQAGDLVTCINCLSNALELLPGDAEDPDLSELLGDAQERIGDLPAALGAYRRALRGFPGPEAIARVHRKIADALEDRGDIATAREGVDAGLQALGEILSVERGWLDLLRCRIAYRLADWEQARDAGESALETLQAFGAAAGTARALLILGHIAMHSPQNDPALAERHLSRALELSTSVEDRAFVADARISLAHLLAWHRRDVEGAMRQASAVEEMLAMTDLPQVHRKIRLFQGMFRLTFLADFEAAETNFRSALNEGRRIYDMATVANAKVGLGYMAYFQGRFADARRYYEEAAAELKAQGLLVDTVNILLALGEACFLEGDQEAVAENLATLMSDESLSRAVGIRSFYVRLTEGYTLLLQGDREGAYAALSDAVRRAEAESGLAEGTMTYDFVSCISWPAVYALLYSGVALRFLGRPEEGDRQLVKAKDVAEAHGAKAWLEGLPKVERRLAEVLGRLLRSPSPAGESRSARAKRRS